MNVRFPGSKIVFVRPLDGVIFEPTPTIKQTQTHTHTHTHETCLWTWNALIVLNTFLGHRNSGWSFPLLQNSVWPMYSYSRHEVFYKKSLKMMAPIWNLTSRSQNRGRDDSIHFCAMMLMLLIFFKFFVSAFSAACHVSYIRLAFWACRGLVPNTKIQNHWENRWSPACLQERFLPETPQSGK